MKGTSATDDRALWHACLGADEEAFGLLWDRHRDAVFRFAGTRVVNRFDAEDITAITFFEAWRLRGKVRLTNGSILPWLLVTCRNVARNGERSRRRYAAMLERLPAPPLPGPADGADEPRLLNAALHALGETDRALIVLTAIDGFNIREAAAKVGISHAAARARLSRAKARLRHHHAIRTGAEGALR